MRRALGRMVLGWVVLAGLFRAVVALPEHCPAVDAPRLRQATAEAVGWFERNQQADGRWLYRYDAHEGRDLGGYNLVRHAGVAMSLYQAAAAGHDDALAVADRGARYALDRLVRHDDWAAFGEPPGLVTTGASALLVAGLAERRLATGDDRFDRQLEAMGRFLAQMVEPSGAVLAYWDLGDDAPVPGATSPFFTGEAFWALARLHALFPADGWDEPARRIARYVAAHRDEVEDWFPDISDHWAAYGLAEMVAWPSELPEVELAYVERQAGIAGIQVRWESQRTDHWPNWWLRGHRALGAGLGTLGEQLTGLWQVAGAEPRMAALRQPLAERTLCTAGMLASRQVSPDDAAAMPEPDRARGAWLLGGITQMDDQQHAMSALLRSVPVAEAAASGAVGAATGLDLDPPRPSAGLVVLALLAALNPLRGPGAVAGTGRIGARRWAVPVVAGAAVLTALAALSGPLLDWLAVSVPTLRIGAGLVLLVTGLVDVVARRRSPGDDGPAEAGADGRAATTAVAAWLRAPAVVVAVSAGADLGVVPVAVMSVAVLALGAVLATARDRVPPGRWTATTRLLAAAGVVAGVALAVDGIYDV